MIWLYRILAFSIGFAALWGVVFLVATTYGWEKIWPHFFGPADMGDVQFEALAKGPKPNQALICPDGICKDEDRDRASPAYTLTVADLSAKFLASLQAETSLERVDDKSDPLRMRFVQRSRLMRFPDTIRIQFFALSDTTSTLAVYSQSQIGTSDIGVNRARMNRWLKRLNEFEQK